MILETPLEERVEFAARVAELEAISLASSIVARFDRFSDLRIELEKARSEVHVEVQNFLKQEVK
jgi:hypothetical protein